jgi:hypothetical protein
MKTSKQSAISVKDAKPKCHRRFRAAAQHAVHPWHLYCRLSDIGANKSRARGLCTSYERFVYKPILGAVLLSIFLALSGCASKPIYKPVDVTVPVTVPCKAPAIDKPKSPFEALDSNASIFEKVKMLLVDRELRKGYETQLEAAAGACS